MIWRWNGTTEFNSHAFYRFSLVRRGDRWKIAAIAQKIYWNDGDPSIHGAAAAQIRPARNRSQ